MAFDLPETLTPSKMSTFKSCPLAFRFSAIDKLPDPPSVASTQGNIVHLALEYLYEREPEDRTERRAQEDLNRAFTDLEHDRIYVDLHLDDDAKADLRQRAARLVADYFDIEDPVAVEPVGVEVKLQAKLDGATIRGIIDRLDVDEGGLTLSDYKALALDTPLPTPEGWTTMGEVAVGDLIFGADGLPHPVVGKSRVFDGPCYEVAFDDGSSITASGDHLWTVHRDSGEVTMTTLQLAASHRNRGGQRDCRIPMPKALTLPAADLPVDPWVFGYWLGNGKMTSGEITWGDPTVPAVVAAHGAALGLPQTREESHAVSATVLGLRTLLRKMDVLGTRRVPAEFLRGSVEQRTALLQGLMDSDGSWNRTRRQAVFVNLNRGLAEVVYELLVSLGQRASWWEGRGEGYGKVVHQYRVAFTPRGFVPFLTSKGDEVDPVGTVKSGRRMVTSVTPAPSVPTACIKVDAPGSLFLCGRQMVPTHNTGKSPAFAYQNQRMEGLMFYALLMRETMGVLPASARLVYLSDGTVLTRSITPQAVTGFERRVRATWAAIETACEREDFRPRVSGLCGWCSFRAYCPAQGGTLP